MSSKPKKAIAPVPVAPLPSSAAGSSFSYVSPMPRGEVHVSKPKDVKRGMHVQWDPKTGTFTVSSLTALRSRVHRALACDIPFPLQPSGCAPKVACLQLIRRAFELQYHNEWNILVQGLPEVWAAALPPSAVSKGGAPPPATQPDSAVSAPKPSKSVSNACSTQRSLRWLSLRGSLETLQSMFVCTVTPSPLNSRQFLDI